MMLKSVYRRSVLRLVVDQDRLRYEDHEALIPNCQATNNDRTNNSRQAATVWL